MDNDFRYIAEDEINVELKNLERLLNEAKELLVKIDNKHPDFIETRAAGSILHDFYCGVEKIFERIAVGFDKDMPGGENWHADLLLQMAKPLKGIRNEVIFMETMNTLKEYMRFRHLFRHIYGFELKWERFAYLFIGLEDIFQKLASDIEKFLKK